MNDQALSSDFLDALQRETFDYFVHEANPLNGLIADKTQAGSPASIAAVGFALSSYPVGVERGFMGRMDAIARTLATLRFFHASVQSADVDATGYKGFYYHFLDMVSGRRVWKCELSTIDSAILIAGMLTAAAYFSGENEDEREIRALARHALPARGLELGAKRRRHGDPWLEARERLSPATAGKAIARR